jgi:hypothetical protein
VDGLEGDAPGNEGGEAGDSAKVRGVVILTQELLILLQETDIHPIAVMALPPTIRLMAIGTMLVFCYLCVRIIQAPYSPAAGKDAIKLSDMPRDPNLDRTSTPLFLSILPASDMYP